jgi:hypothetical protein|tara:strand:+ start:129 stop:608 length:480 start_codon:yes stop_codon:yes gene_type:complete
MLFTISTVVFFFIAIIISQFIADMNLKIAYWLMLLLLYISCANIYISAYFYAKLRSQSGLQGKRGDPGDSGPRGSNGVCVITPNCGIVNCRSLIEKEISSRITVYKKIKDDIKNGNMLSSDQKKILRKINTFIDVLIPVCESGKMTKSEFITHIDETIQ